jgi:CRISPR/Cas system CMR-associated protein Cmr1 (group 7 of RAMP superfamily)
LLTVHVKGFRVCFWETFVFGSTQRNCQAVVSILVNSDPDPIST